MPPSRRRGVTAVALMAVAAGMVEAGCPFAGRALLATQVSSSAPSPSAAASPSPLAASPFYVPGHTVGPYGDHAPRFEGAADLIATTTARLTAALAAEKAAAVEGNTRRRRGLLSPGSTSATPQQEKSPQFFLEVLEEILKEGWEGAVSNLEQSVATRIKLAVMDERLAAAYKMFMVLRTSVTDGLTLRQSFHDCGTYNRYANSTHTIGGCNASIRFEYDEPYNTGLNQAFAFVWSGKHLLDLKWPGLFSTADCIAIAAACSVAANKGPLVNVGYGRVDTDTPDVTLGIGTHGDVGKDLGIEGLLADWSAFGFTPHQLCILSGAHTVGIGAQVTPQSRLGDSNFNNGYYRDVLAGRGFFASDKALADSPLTLPCVQAAAQSQDWFFQEWKREFFEMTWWGTAEQGLERKGLEGREWNWNWNP